MKLRYVIFLFIIPLLLCSCNEQPVKKENVVRVKLHKVKAKEFQFPIRTTGTLSTGNEFKLSFKTGGIINQIYVEEGQEVKARSIMATLELSEIEANVSQAKAAVAKAERDYERTENLYEDNVATKEQLQNAETALEVAQSQLKIATFNLRHSKIIAPSSGTILNVLKEENELVSPGYPVIVFGSTNQSWVLKTNVTDKDLISVSLGDSAIIRFDAYPDEHFSGRLTTISKGADPYTNTYRIEISLEPSSKNLASGFIGNADIFPAASAIYPFIPYDALLEGNELSGTVMKLNNDSSYEKRNIKIKQLLDKGIVIAEGLQSQDVIITEGQHYLDEDSKIRVIE